MKKIAALLLLITAAPEIYAQSQDTGSGLDFLTIGPTAKMLSLGEATTATPLGPASMFSNPALLVFDDQSNLDLNYTLWVSGVNNQFAAVNFPDNMHSFALGVYNSRSDGLSGSNQPGGSSGINYLSLSASGGFQLGPFSAGLTAQYLREQVFQFRANGYAFTGGISTSIMDERIRFGTVLQNIGRMQELDNISTDLPATFKAGMMANVVEFTTPGENDLPLLVGIHADYIIPLNDRSGSDFIDREDGDHFFVTAISTTAADLFYLQGSYKFGPTERPVSFGAGVTVEPIRINYALIPFTTGYGTSHSFGMQFYF